jgi:hypothetical protein
LTDSWTGQKLENMEALRTDLELGLRGIWTTDLHLELRPMDLPNLVNLDVVGITTSDAFADT